MTGSDTQQNRFRWRASDLGEIVAAVRRVSGLDISSYGDAFLARSIEKRLKGTGGTSPASYARRLSGDRAEAEAFACSLRITYSEFFRDPLTFALLERLVLPEIAKEKLSARYAGLRVWSAGCAAGQEAWSLAILLDELAAAHRETLPYRLFASDIAEPALATARAGVYGMAELGNVRLRQLDRYFVRQGECFAIADGLRSQVDFSVYDLLDPDTAAPPASIYGEFDLVLCCNVLLYYRPQAQAFILEKLRHCLAPSGYLVTGEAEKEIVEGAGGFHGAAPTGAAFRLIKTGRRRH